MTRLEIIINSTIKEDLLEELKATGLKENWSCILGVEGLGTSGPRMGTDVWPGINSIMILYAPETDIETILKAARRVKERFPTEGIKAYIIPEAREAL